MEIIWRRIAVAHLEQVRRYLAAHDPAAAERVYDLIFSTVKRLADHPNLGRPGRVTGTRELVVQRTPYIVAYRVHENQLRIVAVLHGAQRWPERL